MHVIELNIKTLFILNLVTIKPAFYQYLSNLSERKTSLFFNN